MVCDDIHQPPYNSSQVLDFSLFRIDNLHLLEFVSFTLIQEFAETLTLTYCLLGKSLLPPNLALLTSYLKWLRVYYGLQLSRMYHLLTDSPLCILKHVVDLIPLGPRLSNLSLEIFDYPLSVTKLPRKSLSILLSFPGLLSALISFFFSHCNQKRVTLVCSWALMLGLILYARILLRDHQVAQLLVLKHEPLKVLMHHLHDIFVLRGALNGNLLLIGLHHH